MYYAIHSTLNGIIPVSVVGINGSMAEDNREPLRAGIAKRGVKGLNRLAQMDIMEMD